MSSCVLYSENFSSKKLWQIDNQNMFIGESIIYTEGDQKNWQIKLSQIFNQPPNYYAILV